MELIPETQIHGQSQQSRYTTGLCNERDDGPGQGRGQSLTVGQNRDCVRNRRTKRKALRETSSNRWSNAEVFYELSAEICKFYLLTKQCTNVVLTWKWDTIFWRGIKLKFWEPHILYRYFIMPLILNFNVIDQAVFAIKSESQRSTFHCLLYVWYPALFFHYLTALDSRAVQSINDAIQRYADETCIKFTQSSNAAYRLKILDNGSCHSYIGRISSSAQPQELSLSKKCTQVSKYFKQVGYNCSLQIFFYATATSKRI